MKNEKRFIIQKEIGNSSWFGFSMLINPAFEVERQPIIDILLKNNVEVRPIVAGNFTKNEVMKYFDYELFGEMKNADYIDKKGFFVGNHHFDIKDKIDYLIGCLKSY